MCGIAGMVGLEDQGSDKMLATMARRGPDSRGIYSVPGCTLLHSRLAIIDPEGGRQPMTLSWAGECYTMVYNGELYNTEFLRRTLEQAGHRFHGHSDTEVLLHAYAEFGEKCLKMLNGIYAFAIWEEKRRRLFLARDRIGVKPLFFRQEGESLIFASEIKTILACPGVRAELDEVGAAQLILLGPGRLPGSGIFRGIREMEPGYWGFFEQGRLTQRQYWHLRDREHRETLEETVAHVRYLVTDAILSQMVSDVPIGTFLSGGLDSSIITALCAGEMAKRGEVLSTFSVDYENNQQYFTPNPFQPTADGDYIRLMADAFHTDHQTTVLSAPELAQTLEEATIARDLPGMADVDFSLLAFCKRIRPKVKVALSGECADEIFGGYPWYRDPQIREQTGFPWAQNTADRASLLSPAVKLDREGFVLDAYEKTCLESDILPGTSPRERRMKEMVNLNFRFFMQTLLDRKDRMSMYSSLEVRVPFCDHRIAEYLYGVPWEFKDYHGQEKGLLREAVKGLLPEPVRLRKKSPYPKTFDPTYERLMEQRFGTILDDASAPLWTLIDKKAARALLERASPWPWYGQLMRRPQLLAYLCQVDFWLRHYGVKLTFG